MTRQGLWMTSALLLCAGSTAALKSQQLFDARSEAVEDYDNADDGGMMSSRELRRMTSFYRAAYVRIGVELLPWRCAAAACTCLGSLLTVLLSVPELRRRRGHGKPSAALPRPSEPVGAPP
jgi:hypothetical protein